MRLTDFSYLLFDLDGTLTDPKEGIVRSIQHALQEMGRPVPDSQDLEWCIGPPLRKFFPKLINSTDDALIEQTIVLFRERFSTIGKYENQVYPGAVEMLEQVKQEGYCLFLATAKATIYTRDILEHFSLSQYFDGIYGSKLDGRFSNKGELINLILTRESIQPEQAMMIGDRHHDIEGAKLNGVKAGGVTYGYGSVAELTNAGADILFHSPAEITRILGKKEITEYSGNVDKHHRLEENPFSYQATKNNRVFVSWHGKLIKTLKGKTADKLIQKLADLDAKGQQLELAKITGNFRHGNER